MKGDFEIGLKFRYVVEFEFNFKDCFEVFFLKVRFHKINLVQEACTEFFAVHLLEFEILQNSWKEKTKSIKKLDNSVSS